MPLLSIPGMNWCRTAFTPSHQISYQAWQIINDATSVLRPLMKRRYDNVLDRTKHSRQQGLYVMVAGNTLGKTRKKVVRNWAKRRVQQAILGRLQLEGFDKIGPNLLQDRKMIKVSGLDLESSHNQDYVKSYVQGLTGTLTVHLKDPILDTPWSDLEQHASLIVNKVLERGGRTP